MGVDIAESFIEGHCFAARRGCSPFIDVGLGPGEVVVPDPHEVSDSKGNGVIDRIESSGRNLLLEPFLLVARKLDVHADNISGSPRLFQRDPGLEIGTARLQSALDCPACAGT